ncbi:hypothetical protein PHMEG_00037591 [Phytophthora megakarya]|uniref:Uncharacterized protein n=1 Tax=Phytophthora megakarya TaxID=4795 RepID=A0A225UJG2_9STRA|nr:hypothetical protein PHMEG_00037591 [Phytophthora megakarya]
MFSTKSRDEFVCSSYWKTYATNTTKDRNALHLRVVDDETWTTFRWCKWIVLNRMVFSFVESKKTRKNAILAAIGENTLKMYLMRVYQSAERRVVEELPSTFGIVLDGSL